jgi:hypothetical protein
MVLGGVQARIQQTEIEEGTRKQIGLYLLDHARPTDTVAMEPLGYIGYYSNLKTYDFLGLSSREVVAARLQGDTEYGAIIRRLHPDWVVLRPFEAAGVERFDPSVLKGYELVGGLDATARLDAYGWIPGEGWLRFDSRFLVYRKKS